MVIHIGNIWFAWSNILFRQNKYQKVPWLFCFDHNLQPSFPKWWLDWWENLVLYLTPCLWNLKGVISIIRTKPSIQDRFTLSSITIENLNYPMPSQSSLPTRWSDSSKSDGGIPLKFLISEYQLYRNPLLCQMIKISDTVTNNLLTDMLRLLSLLLSSLNNFLFLWKMTSNPRERRCY